MPNDTELPDAPRPIGFDPARARRAAADPSRPGERCRAPAGAWRRSSIRGERGQVRLRRGLPYRVLEVRTMDAAEFSALPLLPRLKSWAHRKQTAYTSGADLCQ